MQNIGELEGLDSDQTFINQASNDEPPKHSKHQVYWYQNDHLGTPRELTSNSGNIEWEAVYQAWGNTVTVEWEEVAQVQELNPIQLNGAEQSYLLQPHRFQGQIYDVETGLHYNRFRYYDPDTGRFISHDPIGLLGGDNQFQYAPNPVEWVDSLGLRGFRNAQGRFRGSLNIGEEMSSLPSFSNKTPGQIRSSLRGRGYTSSVAHSGGEIWMKHLPDGNTSAVRLDPRMVRNPPKGFADEVPHVHKESVPTNKVQNGNYKGKDAIQYNDLGCPSNKGSNPNHARDVHIPMQPTRGLYG